MEPELLDRKRGKGLIATVDVEGAPDLLRAAMRRHNLNQRELGEEIGVSSSAISEWIAGNRRPEVKYAPALARLAGAEILEVVEICAGLEPGSLRPGGSPPVEDDISPELLSVMRELPPQDRDLVGSLARQLLERLRTKERDVGGRGRGPGRPRQH